MRTKNAQRMPDLGAGATVLLTLIEVRDGKIYNASDTAAEVRRHSGEAFQLQTWGYIQRGEPYSDHDVARLCSWLRSMWRAPHWVDHETNRERHTLSRELSDREWVEWIGADFERLASLGMLVVERDLSTEKGGDA